MELFPDNAYFNFGRTSEPKKGGDGSSRRRQDSQDKNGTVKGRIDSRIISSPNIFEIYNDSDVDSVCEGASVASVSTANSEELHKQASRHHQDGQQRSSKGQSGSKRFKPFSFLTPQRYRRRSKPSKDESKAEAQEDKASHSGRPASLGSVGEQSQPEPSPSEASTVEYQMNQTPATAEHPAGMTPVVSERHPGDSVVINLSERVFSLQTQTESADFVNYCATHVTTKKKEKKQNDSRKNRKKMGKWDGSIYDASQQKVEDLSKKPPSKEQKQRFDKKMKIFCAVLAAFVVLAIVAVPVGLLLHNSKGKKESSAIQGGAEVMPEDTDAKTWSAESLGGRLAHSEPANATELDALDALEADQGVDQIDEKLSRSSYSPFSLAQAEEENKQLQWLPEKHIQRNIQWRKCIAAPEFCYDLDLHGLDLIGTLPNSIGSLKKLRKLDLSGNLISGSIPASIGDLEDLEQLLLDNNELEGEIPKEVGKLQNLYDLRLHNNHLTGTIPEEIGNLYLLEMLSLSRNKLSGDIPTTLGKMVSLMGIWLQSNKITGEIPKEIGALRDLRYFWAYDNDMQGGIPNVITWLPNLVEFKVDDDMRAKSSPEILEYLKNKLSCLTC